MIKTLTKAQQNAIDALETRQFFKLICGASFTDTEKVMRLSQVYAQAGIHCIDIAPELTALQAVEEGLSLIPPNMTPPLVMVSISLDPDPHFRKIELNEPDCILCDACIPICPTDAIDKTTQAEQKLIISQPLCYGCGRCVETCPTSALALHPFHQDPDKLKALLSHPLVGAVEIHTRFADPYMLPDFLQQLKNVFQNKALSVCFRPDTVKTSQWSDFLNKLQAFNKESNPQFPLIIQIDGAPMSGSDQADTSLPALKSAKAFKQQCQDQFPFITLSGGINAKTAEHLSQSDYSFISGVGIGTVARQAVWRHLEKNKTEPLGQEDHALTIAKRLVQAFQHG